MVEDARREAAGHRPACLAYEAAEGRLFRVDNRGRREVPLSGDLQRKLVAYMAARNRDNQDRPVLCTHKELIVALWGKKPNYGSKDLWNVVYRLKEGLEVGGSGDPPLIENVRGRGYRLVTCAPGEFETTPTAVSVRHPRGSRALRLTWTVLVVLLVGVLLWVGGSAILPFARPSPVLHQGSTGEDVLQVQKDLRALGYDPTYLDGIYGPLTDAAVRAFQRDQGLVPDGDVGPRTREALERAMRQPRPTPRGP